MSEDKYSSIETGVARLMYNLHHGFRADEEREWEMASAVCRRHWLRIARATTSRFGSYQREGPTLQSEIEAAEAEQPAGFVDQECG